MRLDAFEERPAHSSPRRLHKDGERFFALHLMERVGVEGGESIVTENDGRLLLRYAMTANGETLLIDDAKVWHHVEDLRVTGGWRKGHRCVLLIDFTPIKRVIEMPDRIDPPAAWLRVPATE